MFPVHLGGLVLALTLTMPGAGPLCGSATQCAAAEDAAVQEFEGRVAAYVRLYRQLERPLPTLEISENLADVHAAMEALAKQIRHARKDARQGDLFTPAAADLFRRRIAACLPPEQMAAVLAEQDEDVPRGATRIRVNGTWPRQLPFTFVPPQLICALPALPPELQYRIVGRSLVLWDHHTNLIVDILPNAFPG